MNFYNQYRDQVVLDEGLKDYPLAHEYIKEHELKHREIGFNPIQQALHEFRHDLFMYCSDSEAAHEVRDYLFNDPSPHWKLRAEDVFVTLVRGIWSIPMIYYWQYYKKFKK